MRFGAAATTAHVILDTATRRIKRVRYNKVGVCRCVIVIRIKNNSEALFHRLLTRINTR
jgi:hypothetical protein